MVETFAPPYIEGQIYSFDAEFRFKNSLEDPSAIRLKINKNPLEEETATLVYGVDPEITKIAKGKYHVDIRLDESGVWHFRLESDGIITVEQWKRRIVAADPA
jgi:hypothetical protein